MCSWGYGKSNGPSTWEKVAPDAAGKKQSPIDIITKAAHYDETLQKTPLQVNVHSDGKQSFEPSKHGFSVAFCGDQHSSLRGGPLPANHEYTLAQFHFHWSDTDKEGSEHTLDGKPFAAEVHFVFYDKAQHHTFEQAVKSHGLSVLGFFIKSGSKDNILFKPLFDVIESQQKSGGKFHSHTLHPNLEMNLILSQVNQQKYFTYPGSLTTPPCVECVQWIVFQEPMEFSEHQFNLLRATHPATECGCEGTKHNFRPVCSLNDRQVKASFRH